MIAIVQRVTRAKVTVKSENYAASIGAGLCVLLGVEQADTEDDATWMAGKLARMRVFRNQDGKMNRSIQDVGGAILLISQFTLAGDCTKGNRPSFVGAADPALGERLYDMVADLIRLEHKVPVKTGLFGAMMLVEIANDGPVTLIVRSR